ncbi:MAG: transglutaminase-like domain-containing protein [Saprospiraceae bacterium]|nr:transglutaminase-like domain-containing protein [Saprospiraceae bacterium]
MKYITFLFLFAAQISVAQNSSLSKVIQKIDYQEDTLQAVFDWVTDNIRYDVAKLNLSEKERAKKTKRKYKTREEYKTGQLETVIRKKKGVCEDYTLLFDAIVKELGYRSYVISGVTKNKQGTIRRGSSHSWITVYVDGKWRLYDPTWGAGYVKDNKKFIKKYKPQWYDVDPSKLIATHYPYDPIWQMLDRPLLFEDFKKSRASTFEQEEYNYEDKIQTYLAQDKYERAKSELERSEPFGGNNKKIKTHRVNLQKIVEASVSRNKAESLQLHLETCRNTSTQFGEYINAKNSNFDSEEWSVEKSKTTLLKMKEDLGIAIEEMSMTKMKRSKSKGSFKKYVAQSKKLLERIDKELVFLESKS